MEIKPKLIITIKGGTIINITSNIDCDIQIIDNDLETNEVYEPDFIDTDLIFEK